MGISPNEMKALIESQNEDWDRIEVRKIKLSTGERREEGRRKPNGSARNFLGMERRVSIERRTNNGKGRIKHGLEYKNL